MNLHGKNSKWEDESPDEPQFQRLGGSLALPSWRPTNPFCLGAEQYLLIRLVIVAFARY